MSKLAKCLISIAILTQVAFIDHYSNNFAFAYEQGQNQSSGSARLIRIPLMRTVTQGAGSLSQPVISYYAPISIGTPPVNFNVQFDVGFGDSFVPHYNWNPFKINLHYSTGYQCKSSSTCARKNRDYTIEYQQCQLKGTIYEDVLTFNSAYANNSNNVLPVDQQQQQQQNNRQKEKNNMQNTTTNQKISLPTSIRQNFLAINDASDARFKNLPIDGYIGLGPQVQSLQSVTNILVNLVNSKQLDNLQFSLWFNPVLDSNQGGELVFGGVDINRYQGQVYWHQLSQPLSVNDEWALNLQYVSVGQQPIGTNCYGKCQAVLSSGLNEIYGPTADVKAIYDLLKTIPTYSGLQTIDCQRISSLPILSFTIDGIPYAVLPSNYIRKAGSDGKKDSVCYVAILPTNSNDSKNQNRWILGTNFLGAYYSIFDITYRQVGFASLR